MLDLLKKYFGYDRFRPLQQEVVEQCLAKKDALVLMPTGGGKSLCFQLPALAFPGLTIVISPLIALMKDQVDGLRGNGVNAAYLNSTVPAFEARQIEQAAKNGELKLLYLAPERLAMPQTQDFLKTLNISFFAIDEAHCISEWGHDFRPDYRNLAKLRELFPQVPIMALTATANARVKGDIIQQLKLQGGRIFQSSFNRPNLTYRVMPKKKVFEQMLGEIMDRPGQAIIIYCFSRKGTEQIAEKLSLNGIKAAAYHAGLPPEERVRVQDDFIRDRIPVIAATVAFGMGIDKPDVRLVIHADLPKSIEGYYQETGRAGRDGLPSECLLFYSSGDCYKHAMFIREMESMAEQQRATKQLQEMSRLGEITTCRRAYLLNYFGETWTEQNCNGCDNCLPARAPKVHRRAATVATDYDQVLFDKLRVIRRQIAEQRNIPPYMVFGDKSLQEMAQLYPQSLQTFGRISGVGKEKLVQYGDAFLEAICAHAVSLGKEDYVSFKPVEPPKKMGGTVLETVQLFQQKRTPTDISRQRNLSIGTVLGHLEMAMEQGMSLDTAHVTFSPPERLETIKSAFAKAGNGLLSPVKALLGDAYSYDELRLARFLMVVEERGGA